MAVLFWCLSKCVFPISSFRCIWIFSMDILEFIFSMSALAECAAKNAIFFNVHSLVNTRKFWSVPKIQLRRLVCLSSFDSRNFKASDSAGVKLKIKKKTLKNDWLKKYFYEYFSLVMNRFSLCFFNDNFFNIPLK